MLKDEPSVTLTEISLDSMWEAVLVAWMEMKLLLKTVEVLSLVMMVEVLFLVMMVEPILIVMMVETLLVLRMVERYSLVMYLGWARVLPAPMLLVQRNL